MTKDYNVNVEIQIHKGPPLTNAEVNNISSKLSNEGISIENTYISTWNTVTKQTINYYGVTTLHGGEPAAKAHARISTVISQYDCILSRWKYLGGWDTEFESPSKTMTPTTTPAATRAAMLAYMQGDH
tara:strand:+ start:184 stop:567 length:384 start_codon:yes stop_codon:yes gene_type:complete